MVLLLQPLLLLTVLSVLYDVSRCAADCGLSSKCRNLMPRNSASDSLDLDCSTSSPILSYNFDGLLNIDSFIIECNGTTGCVGLVQNFGDIDYNTDALTNLSIANINLTEPNTQCTVTICYDTSFDRSYIANRSCTFQGIIEPPATTTEVTPTVTTTTMTTTMTTTTMSTTVNIQPTPTPEDGPSPEELGLLNLLVVLLIPVAVVVLCVSTVLYTRRLQRNKFLKYRLTFPYQDEDGASDIRDIISFSSSSFAKLQISGSVYSIFDKLQYKDMASLSEAITNDSLHSHKSEGKVDLADPEIVAKASRVSSVDSTVILDSQDGPTQQSVGRDAHGSDRPYVPAEMAGTSSNTRPDVPTSKEFVVDFTELNATMEEVNEEQRDGNQIVKLRPNILNYKVGESDSGYMLSIPAARVVNELTFNSERISEAESKCVISTTMPYRKEGNIESEFGSIETNLFEGGYVRELHRGKLFSQSSNVSFVLADAQSMGDSVLDENLPDHQTVVQGPPDFGSGKELDLKSHCNSENLPQLFDGNSNFDRDATNPTLQESSSNFTATDPHFKSSKDSDGSSLNHVNHSSIGSSAGTTETAMVENARGETENGLKTELQTQKDVVGRVKPGSTEYGEKLRKSEVNASLRNSSLDSDRNELPYLPSDASTTSTSAQTMNGYIASNSSGYATDELPYLPSDVSTATSGQAAIGYIASNSSYATDELPYLPSDVSTANGRIPSNSSSGYSTDELTNLLHASTTPAFPSKNIAMLDEYIPRSSSSSSDYHIDEYSYEYLPNDASSTSQSKFAETLNGYVVSSECSTMNHTEVGSSRGPTTTELTFLPFSKKLVDHPV